VGVVVVQADEAFTGAVDQAGGCAEQGAAQDGGSRLAQHGVVVQSEVSQPGEEVGGDGHDGAPGLVEREGVGR